MSLRLKVEAILIITISLVVGFSYFLQQSLLVSRLNLAEKDAAVKDMMRCIDALNRTTSGLDALASDWADHPDLFRQLSDGAATENPNQLLDAIPGGDALDFALLGNSHGAPVWSVVRTESPAGPARPESGWLKDVLSTGAESTRKKGAVLSGDGPLLVATQTVTGASDGDCVLVVGRRVNRALMMNLFRQTGLAFQVWVAGDPEAPSEAKTIIADYRKNGQTVKAYPLNDRLFRTYAVYPDINGNAGLLLYADLERGIFSQARDIMQTGLLVQATLAALGLVALVLFFRREITNPLSRMTRHTAAIAATNDLSGRLSLSRKDEIGVLADSFDEMVAQLERDRERRRQSQDALQRSEERFAAAVNGANDGLWDWDLRDGRIYFSPRWKSMLGYADDEIGTSLDDWFALIHTEDQTYVRATLDAHLKGETEHVESEYRIRHADGTYLWVLCRGLVVHNSAGARVRMAGSQTDITPRKRVEEQLAHQAFHDALTGLPNRALFLDRLGQAMRHARRTRGYMFAVLFLDLDRFKVVNDGLGHVIGDKLLKAFSDALAGILRANDTIARYESTIARFGGDEFVVLLDGIRDIADASRVADRILLFLKKPFQIEVHEVFTSVSIGIAMSGVDYESPEEFLRNADTAMYRAKGRGKACYEIFDLDMHSLAIERLELENDLRRAIDRKEFCVFYQPIVSLETGRIDSFEALARWQHPERGMVSPVKFIPIAEETGMIVQIGEMIFRSACAQTRHWQTEFPHMGELNVSVNLSVKEFARPDLLESVESALQETGLDPKHLKLEITESAVMENVELVSSTLMKLRAHHIQLSIDDFGTGYSSLSYLHRFPLNNLKIDQVFVKDMHKSADDELIVRTILMLAKNLRMKVIAEGIEIPEHLATLCRNGCDYGQGYYFAKPLNVEEATTLLAQQTAWNEVVIRERV